MPRMTLSFKLPEERSEATLAQNGVAFYSVIHELDEWLRMRNKHGANEKDGAQEGTEIRDRLWEILEEQGLGNFHDLGC